MPRTSYGRQELPEYRVWVAMRQRCRENLPNYEHVSVCPEWDDFWQFYRDVGPRPEGTSIDRIDPWGNYEPGNVRWATPSQQASNRRPWTLPVPEKCRHGHEYVVVYDSSGYRRCAECKKQHDRERSLADWEKRRNG